MVFDAGGSLARRRHRLFRPLFSSSLLYFSAPSSLCSSTFFQFPFLFLGLASSSAMDGTASFCRRYLHVVLLLLLICSPCSALTTIFLSTFALESNESTSRGLPAQGVRRPDLQYLGRLLPSPSFGTLNHLRLRKISSNAPAATAISRFPSYAVCVPSRVLRAFLAHPRSRSSCLWRLGFLMRRSSNCISYGTEGLPAVLYYHGEDPTNSDDHCSFTGSTLLSDEIKKPRGSRSDRPSSTIAVNSHPKKLIYEKPSCDSYKFVLVRVSPTSLPPASFPQGGFWSSDHFDGGCKGSYISDYISESLCKEELSTSEHSLCEMIWPTSTLRGKFIPSGTFIPSGIFNPSGIFVPSGIFIPSGTFTHSGISILTALHSIKLICTESVEATIHILMRIEVKDHVSKSLSKWTISTPMPDIEAVLKFTSSTSDLELDRLIILLDILSSVMKFEYLSIVCTFWFLRIIRLVVLYVGAYMHLLCVIVN